MARILITGASGAGTSTLARALAGRLASQCFDADEFFWHPTDPPFWDRRPVAERLALLRAMVLPRRDWILAGSLIGWDEGLGERLDLAVLLRLDRALRLARLEAREMRRGGVDPEFLAWAQGYDDPAFAGRNLRRQQDWLAGLGCPVIALDAAAAVEALAGAVVSALDRREARP